MRHTQLCNCGFYAAAVRNVRVKTSSAQYIGIWHAEVLSMAMEEGYPGTGPIQSSLRLLIGEVGPAGFTSDIQVPWVSGCVSCSWKVEEQSAWSASGVMRMHTPQSHTSAPKDKQTASCFRIHQVQACHIWGRPQCACFTCVRIVQL